METPRSPETLTFSHDLSEFGHQQLAEQIITIARAKGMDEIAPGEDFGNDPFTTEFQLRLQQVQAFEEFAPPKIQVDLIDGLPRRYNGTRRKLPEFASIDQIANNIGPTIANLDTLNAVGLTKAQQVLFLRGVIIATTTQAWEAERDPDNSRKRFTNKKQALQRRALNALRHLATNPVKIPEQIDYTTRSRFTAAYTAGYLARTVERELHAQGLPAYSTTSIDEAMHLPIPFGKLASGDQEEIFSVFPPGESMNDGDSEPTTYKSVHPGEVDETRIKDLRGLQHIFGNSTTIFRYYETIQPFTRNEKRPSSLPKTPHTETSPSDECEEDDEKSNYLVLVIEHLDSNDEKKVHIVADNQEVGNACYALRQEVLEEWERLTGIHLTWSDVFSLSRWGARQLGARDFHHKNGSDVKQRVHAYLRQEASSLVTETFAAIFDPKPKEPFDENMQPTKYNRMPPVMIGLIQRSEILREMWPLIRQVGYKEAVRTMSVRDQLEAETRSEAPPAPPRKTFQDRAKELFADVVRTEFEIQRENEQNQ